MLQNFIKKIVSHKIIVGIGIIVLVGTGYFMYKKANNNGGGIRYVLAAVEKGTIVTFISGSGQVAALDQVDIKPKVSGEISGLYINKNAEVKAGQLLAELNFEDAQKSVRDAETALSNAQHDLDAAEADSEQIKIDAERSLATAYEDGYNAVSTTFFKLSDYMKDLKDVLGTDNESRKYVTGYSVILGADYPFITKLLDNYDVANKLFTDNFVTFRKTDKDADRTIIYNLLNQTIDTTKTISEALESARHMFDACTILSYKSFNVSSQIDAMQPKIESDISAIYSAMSSLQQIKNTIDDTNTNTPKNIEDAQFSIKTAQNSVTQKEDALSAVKTDLAEYYIYAPFAGVVAEVNVKKGDSVSGVTVLASIITKQEIAEISLNEVDAAKVKVGQKVNVTFDAVSDLNITGKVVDIDTLGTVTQGVVNYTVKISFDTQDERVKPGMSVTADIITDAKSDILTVPNSAIKSQGSSKYVELAEGLGNDGQQLLANVSASAIKSPLQQQTVETGLSNDTYTEVVSGLKEGDIVVSSTISSNNTNTGGSTQTQSSQIRIPGISNFGGGR